MGLEITHDGFLIFTDSSGNEIRLDCDISETTFDNEDNSQENTQVSLDDMINESVDVYERRRDGESDAAYEDVDVNFNREPEQMIGIDMNHEVVGSFSVDPATFRDATGDIGAFTLNEDVATTTFVQGLNLTEMEERIARLENVDIDSRITCLENEVYCNNPETDSMLMRIGNLEAYLASANDLIERLKGYLQWVMNDVQQLQTDTNSEHISDYPNMEDVA